VVVKDIFEKSPEYFLFPFFVVIVILVVVEGMQFARLKYKLEQSVRIMRFDIRQSLASPGRRQCVVVRRKERETNPVKNM